MPTKSSWSSSSTSICHRSRPHASPHRESARTPQPPQCSGDLGNPALDLTHFFLRVEKVGLVKNLIWIERLGSAILLLAPIVFIAVKAPILLALQLVIGLLLLTIRIVVHVATLPVEFDASFGKALLVLERGGYLAASDLPAARSVLRAAAWTYVAAALATLLDVARWFRMLRF